MFKNYITVYWKRTSIIILTFIFLFLASLIGGLNLAKAADSFIEIVKTGPETANPGDQIEFTLTIRTYGIGTVIGAEVWDDLQYAGLDRYEIFRRDLTEAELATLNAGDPVVIMVPYQVPCDAGGHTLDNDGYVEATFELRGPGTGTPGYWMNHPEAWPVDEIEIGGVVYSKDEAIAYMKDPVKGDKTFTMFPALVAAKLNVLIGNDDSCVADTIAAADAWMAQYPIGSDVPGNSDAWKDGEPLYKTLDDYNNGLLCAPHRDNPDGTVVKFATNDHDVSIPRPDQVDCTPAIDLDKLVNGQDSANVNVGDPLSFEYIVSNTGDAAIFNIEVKDDNETPGDTGDDISIGTINNLAPGQSKTFTLDATAESGSHTNVGEACGTSSGSSGSQSVCDNDSVTYTTP